MLFPRPVADVDPLDVYADPLGEPRDRPYVRLNMIASLDGAISVDGRSGPLGGPADRDLFQVLRSLSDVILVGAGTVRTERYGPVQLPEPLRRAREERGQPASVPIAVFTRSLDLDWQSPFFTEAIERPIVVTTKQGAAKAPAQARQVADVVIAGDGDVDMRQAIDVLAARGAHFALGEGGPRLNGHLAGVGLVDELCLTVAPRLVGGGGAGVFVDPSPAWRPEVTVTQVLEDDGLLFLRVSCRDPGELAGPRSPSAEV